MNFIALIGALALTYYRPHRRQDWLQEIFSPFAQLLERSFNGGNRLQGATAWVLAVLLPSVLVGIVYYVLLQINAILGLVFGLVVLYFTLRLSQFGPRAEGVIAALRTGNIGEARLLLEQWAKVDSDHLNTTQVAQVSIETVLTRSHYGLLAPIFWFVVFGPAGALFYRLSHIVTLEWQSEEDTQFNHLARKVFYWFNWPPAFVTAGSFAIVGDFEDAIYCWRAQAETWSDKAMGMVLASGAGALGVRIGEPLPMNGILMYRPEIGLGETADADYVRSAVGLVWRVLALVIGLLLLLTFAHWLGQ
ncbi:adenosylcobinamide-phosphate synthase [Methylobacillus rhizosphaerae]|uniref:Cobalamin biosynthesis protein CobD n=1 Tax=Methylobacillus rhizosphaerae TaxID=551994 RepID=A0A238XU47_9PROT|nr:CobD/CbiB family protein [Methylobacillus rhizosphaerae]SNR61963.1 adenosylcobinamide-phosphate synthase [Methylobacillus rhizosphaerae]